MFKQMVLILNGHTVQMAEGGFEVVQTCANVISLGHEIWLEARVSQYLEIWLDRESHNILRFKVKFVSINEI